MPEICTALLIIKIITQLHLGHTYDFHENTLNWLKQLHFKTSSTRSNKDEVPVHTTKAYKEVKVQLHTFLPSALAEGEWSNSHPRKGAPHKIPSKKIGSSRT
jgi:hypothetical protein